MNQLVLFVQGPRGPPGKPGSKGHAGPMGLEGLGGHAGLPGLPGPAVSVKNKYIFKKNMLTYDAKASVISDLISYLHPML